MRAELEKTQRMRKASAALRFVDSAPVEMFMILIVILAILHDFPSVVRDATSVRTPDSKAYDLGCSVFLVTIFSAELAFRVFAHVSIKGNFLLGVAQCFRDAMRYVDFVCLALEFFTLVQLTQKNSRGSGFRGAYIRLLRILKAGKMVKVSRVYRSPSVQDFFAWLFFFQVAAFGVDDVIKDHRFHLDRVELLREQRETRRAGAVSFLVSESSF